jgi:hypothetical protein
MNNHATKSKRREKDATHLRLEKPRLRFLEGSAGAFAAPADASADDPATGGSAPTSRVGSVTTCSTPGDGGAVGSHLSEVVRSPSLSSSSKDEFTSTDGGERPSYSRSW